MTLEDKKKEFLEKFAKEQLIEMYMQVSFERDVLMEENERKQKLIESIIPHGDYCHFNHIKDGHYMAKPCPFWERKDYGIDGIYEYCNYLDNVLSVDDQVKDCNVNVDEKEVEEPTDRPPCCVDHNVYGATCDNCEFGEVDGEVLQYLRDIGEVEE